LLELLMNRPLLALPNQSIAPQCYEDDRLAGSRVFMFGNLFAGRKPAPKEEEAGAGPLAPRGLLFQEFPDNGLEGGLRWTKAVV
jgi:hypothetical protein